MRSSLAIAATWMLVGAASAACGGPASAVASTRDSGAAREDAGENVRPALVDSGRANAPDEGAPSNTYPAFPVDAPQIESSGGPVLTAPVVVTITWNGDPNVDRFEAFDDSIGASSYWSTINAQYGVGQPIGGESNHVHIATPPQGTLSDQDLRDLIAANAGQGAPDGGTAWPAPTSQMIYAFYTPPSASVMVEGQDACLEGFGGYHYETTAGGMQVAYAVMLQCLTYSADDALTGASHELNEASTDPFPSTHPAYAGFDLPHAAYELFNDFQDELGDACEANQDAYFDTAEPSFAYPVQRQWSNESAHGGHDPCAPVPSLPYFNVTLFPNQEDAITLNLDALMDGSIRTKGIKAPLHQARTFKIGLFSDQATSGPWKIAAHVDPEMPFTDLDGNTLDNGSAVITLDRVSGVNGEMATVTVTPTAFSSFGFIFVYFTSTLGEVVNYQPLLIGAM